ncbi:MAG: hypothetical protein ACRCUQ_02150 [Alphaproteobacteria bacterium]
MKRTIFYGLCFIIAFLSGCSHHKITQSKDLSTGEPVFKLESAPITGVKNLQGGHTKLGIKKTNKKTLACWIVFTTEDSKNTPLDKPDLIIKSYKNKKIIQEIQITKTTKYCAEDYIFTLLTKKEAKEISPKPETKQTISAKDIWPSYPSYTKRCGLYALTTLLNHSHEIAISFELSYDQFDSLLASDDTKILIQTYSEPIIASIEKEQLKPLLEFKKAYSAQGVTEKALQR